MEEPLFNLKALSGNGIDAAFKKAERYRLLNEPRECESICRDILAVDPKNQKAIVNLLLSLTDQFHRHPCPTIRDTRALLDDLDSEYSRSYYAGIICERKAKAQLRRGNPECGHIAYKWFREAMEFYEEAETLCETDDHTVLLRWNSCARIIMANDDICDAPVDNFQPMLE